MTVSEVVKIGKELSKTSNIRMAFIHSNEEDMIKAIKHHVKYKFPDFSEETIHNISMFIFGYNINNVIKPR